MSKLMTPCDKANHVCDKSQYKQATLWEKIKLSIHLIYCTACRKYSKNNAILTEKIMESDVECLDKKCKDAMKEKLEKAIKDDSNQQLTLKLAIILAILLPKKNNNIYFAPLY